MTLPEMALRWVRRELDDAAFEEWLYTNPDARKSLGPGMWLELTSMDFRDPYATYAASVRLAGKATMTCICPVLRDRQYIPITGLLRMDVWLDTICSRTPWLDLKRCKGCGQHWYVATDTVDDGWYLQRLTDSEADLAKRSSWPDTFDAFPYVWPQQPGPPGRPETRPTGFASGVALHFLERAQLDNRSE